MNRLNTNNALYTVRLNQTTKQFEIWTASTRAGTWGGYSDPVVGDIDGVNGADVFNFDIGQMGTYVWLSNADGSYSAGTWHPFSGLTGIDPAWRRDVGDLNDDGRTDLILNLATGDKNETLIAYGVPQGSTIAPRVLDTPAGVVKHLAPPASGWSSYERRIVDVNGDDKDDIVWADPAGTLTIYVGLAR